MDDQKELLIEFEKILGDDNVPKNIKIKINTIITTLDEKNTATGIKANKALQELDEISEENNIPEYIRTQIWSIVSILESLK